MLNMICLDVKYDISKWHIGTSNGRAGGQEGILPLQLTNDDDDDDDDDDDELASSWHNWQTLIPPVFQHHRYYVCSYCSVLFSFLLCCLYYFLRVASSFLGFYPCCDGLVAFPFHWCSPCVCVPFVICSVTFFEFVLVIVVIECFCFFCLFFVAFIVLFFLEFEHLPVVVSVILLILN